MQYRVKDLPDTLRKVVVNSNGCWVWQGSLFRKGYGRGFLLGHSTRSAHRLVFESLVGKIPDGMECHHTCDNKACCNPEHIAVMSMLEHKQEHLRTHCRVCGEPLSGGNLYVQPKTGFRFCRTCQLRRYRELRLRRAKADSNLVIMEKEI